MEKLINLNLILKQSWQEKYELYKNLNSSIIDEGINICGIKTGLKEDTEALRLAVAKRLVDLKTEAIENELKKLNFNQSQIKDIKKPLFKLALKFNMQNLENLIERAINDGLIKGFSKALIMGVHEIGLAINEWQISWQEKIIDGTNEELLDKFKELSEAVKWLKQNGLFMRTPQGEAADRAYGALVKSGAGYDMRTYAEAFKDEFSAIDAAFFNAIKAMKDNLNQTDELISSADAAAYIEYFSALKEAFACKEVNECIGKWQDAERVWMRVKAPLQVGHPLEYYEDALTHAVAPEWDLRLASNSAIDENKLKSQMISTFEHFYKNLGADDESMRTQVIENIKKTQLYISAPMLFYAAELDGLFSAQVVPNDETVSSECGKKIFAFTDHIRTASMARPFMRLSTEIFPSEFLEFNRRVLFVRPRLWKQVYNASTIGHEFGHIFFIGEQTEKLMNESGEFKFIEEYKATAGGLVNFFLNDKEVSGELRIAVFAELIARAVGLIAWKNVPEVRAYYCEGLIHLSLLFSSKAIEFNGTSLEVDISAAAYERFKKLCLLTYESLAIHYIEQNDASTWLKNYCVKDDKTYLPKQSEVEEFVKYYYNRYELIGGELDTSGAWARYSAQAINE
ncbi:invasion protein CiaB [Campylobacter sp. 19-13652]|uniref:invasion protein CiaB n=1 Tax=Campylobacter sp. 19-13652 TaxID=2840180 RepID=UPI001C76CC63|nr:invasion protein CiaB [Campylobacter sp. 19-13652]BCX80068.1 invasion antigen B [Campylobacter sp. 19-13652]